MSLDIFQDPSKLRESENSPAITDMPGKEGEQLAPNPEEKGTQPEHNVALVRGAETLSQPGQGQTVFDLVVQLQRQLADVQARLDQHEATLDQQQVRLDQQQARLDQQQATVDQHEAQRDHLRKLKREWQRGYREQNLEEVRQRDAEYRRRKRARERGETLP